MNWTDIEEYCLGPYWIALPFFREKANEQILDYYFLTIEEDTLLLERFMAFKEAAHWLDLL